MSDIVRNAAMFAVKSFRSAIFLLLGMPSLSLLSAPATIEYNREVRPILSENCFPCHGTDAAARKAKLRLDNFEDATAQREDSAAAIVPGKPNESEIIRRILDTGDDIMPPEKSHKVLTAAQKELLKRWVAQGAKYQPHWAFVAPQRPQLPKVKNQQWPRHPVDHFILARLDHEKLKPAPEADRRTLARRVSLDLTGLPPQPEEVEAFVADQSPDAYEKLVDRYLASPHWGEHRGRYWLDAARYGDTHGIHFDNFREIWAYRDWVIHAFNTNMPFDQFTVEQLAGDLLPNATIDQKIGSGFNRCNITTSEGGAIEEEYAVLYTRDRTDTTSQVWLGLTAGCAVCHDHKYDPLSQKEFYQLSAFFNNTTQKAMDGNVKDTPPVMVVTRPEERTRWEQLLGETNAVTRRVAQRKESARPEFTTWRANPDLTKLESLRSGKAPAFHAPLNENDAKLTTEFRGATQTHSLSTNAAWQAGAVSAKALTVNGESPVVLDEVGDYSRDEAFSYATWIRTTENKTGSALARMEDRDGKYRGWDLWLQDNKPGAHFVHEWPDDSIKVVAKRALPKDRWVHVCVTYDGSSKAKGIKIYINGENQELEVERDKLTRTIRTDAPFKIGQRNTGSKLEGIALQEVRIYDRELKADEARAEAVVPRLKWLTSRPDEEWTKEEKDGAYELWLREFDEPYRTETAALKKLKDEQKEIAGRGTIAHVMNERSEAAEAFLLFRGEYDKRRDKLAPATPAIFPPMPDELPRNRLGFAQWLMRPEHPLAARVTVNRFWQEIFGVGIVRTSGDFGVAGEMPSHPELLDWLAVDFRESGWDVKRFYKQLVTSATYRQSAVATKDKLAKDPQNRLFARGPRFRMDAEMVRDYALASSGLLVDKIGGPSVKPYQPDGVWEAVAMPISDTAKYKRDNGENLYRRSLYTFWKRSAPPASMEIFNAPSRESCTVRRERTDTPLQALVTLNDPQFFEAARNLAQRTLKEGGKKDEERLDYLARQVVARPLSAREQKVVGNLLKEMLAHYETERRAAAEVIAVGESKADGALDVAQLAAYTMVANQMLNLDEVLNK
jgi:hypothetical protein